MDAVNDDDSPPNNPVNTPVCWIHMLPTELLSGILVNVAARNPRTPTDNVHQPESNSVPFQPDYLLVAQLVCKRWKEVTMRTPALWAVLDFWRMQAENFTRFFCNSGILDMWIDLDLLPITGRDQPHRFRENMYLTFRQHSRRISQLNVRGCNVRMFLVMYQNLLAELVSLRELTLHCGGWTGWVTDAICRNLETLILIEKGDSAARIEEVLAALNRCPNLRALHLENQTITRNRHSAAPQHLVLHHLEKLILRSFYGWDMRRVFNHMTTPRLKELFVSGGYHCADGAERLDLRCPILETLVLEGLDISLDAIKELSHVKNLVLLHNRDTDSEATIDMTLRRLHLYWGSLGYPIPLETLKTGNIRPSHLFSLLDGIRHTATLNLRKVAIYYPEAFCLTNLGEFEELSDGLVKLSSLVETEVHKIPAGDIEVDAYTTVREGGREWFVALEKFSALSL